MIVMDWLHCDVLPVWFAELNPYVSCSDSAFEGENNGTMVKPYSTA
jgi:hypothetical protein